MKIATHAIVVIHRATLVINRISENPIANQQLVTTRAKVTMLNSGNWSILVILKPLDMTTIMVTIFMMMTPGEGIEKTQQLLSLV